MWKVRYNLRKLVGKGWGAALVMESLHMKQHQELEFLSLHHCYWLKILGTDPTTEVDKDLKV